MAAIGTRFWDRPYRRRRARRTGSAHADRCPGAHSQRSLSAPFSRSEVDMRGRYTALGMAIAVVAAVQLTAFERGLFNLRPTMPVVVLFNPQNNDVSPLDAESALLVGMNAWNNVSGSRVEFVYGGRVTDTDVGLDGRNVVIFRDASPPDTF